MFCGIVPQGMERIMDEPVVLRTAKVGGFVKEDVLQYVDELNSKNFALEEQLKTLQEGNVADPQEVSRLRKQVDNLQEKLNASNNALRVAKAEAEAAKKQHDADTTTINQLRNQLAQGGGANAANADQTAELNNAKSALVKAKAEIDKLKANLTAAEQQAAATAKSSAEPADTAAKDAEIAKIKNELSSKESAIATKNNELAEKNKQLNEKDQLIAAKDKEIAGKNEEITKLNNEISELKSNAENTAIPSGLDMGALFAEAQRTAMKITVEAKNAAEKITSEAQTQAKKIVDDTNAEAEKKISEANSTAENCVKEANEQAKLTVFSANDRAEKINAMSEKVRNLLLNEIESVNNKFNDVSGLLQKLTEQATVKVNDAKRVITDAKNSVEEISESTTIKKAEVPDNKNFNKPIQNNKPMNKTEERPVHKPNPAFNQPQNQNQHQVHQDRQAKKAADFNFDMSEILKAAEEEAAKEEQQGN